MPGEQQGDCGGESGVESATNVGRLSAIWPEFVNLAKMTEGTARDGLWESRSPKAESEAPGLFRVVRGQGPVHPRRERARLPEWGTARPTSTVIYFLPRWLRGAPSIGFPAKLALPQPGKVNFYRGTAPVFVAERDSTTWKFAPGSRPHPPSGGSFCI
jgi:hypothetical protein